jgi:hypothetical protein
MAADRIGIEATLSALALIPLAAALLTLPLPSRARVAAPVQAAEVGVAEPEG